MRRLFVLIAALGCGTLEEHRTHERAAACVAACPAIHATHNEEAIIGALCENWRCKCLCIGGGSDPAGFCASAMAKQCMK
jgi:hypothetical protein